VILFTVDGVLPSLKRWSRKATTSFFGEQPNASVRTGPEILQKQVPGLPIGQHGSGAYCAFLGFNPGIELLLYGRIS